MIDNELVALIGGLLTIAGVLVAVTRHMTQLQSELRISELKKESQAQIAQLQAEKNELEKRAILEVQTAAHVRSELTAKNQLLLEELAAARRGGALASAIKGEVDDELIRIMRLTSASGGSVWLPLRSARSGELEGLVFLSIQPITENTAKLKSKVMPLHSLGGRCFTSGQPLVVANAKGSADHFDKADQVTGFRTEDTLSYPLRFDGKVIGVLQLLNKADGTFSQIDLDRVERLSTNLVQKVANFANTPNSMEVLGFGEDRETESATILFCDLTASSALFGSLNTAAAIHHINEYFEAVCNVVFHRGGTIDKYSGDGALFRFNVPYRIEDHPGAAVRAAVAVRGAFENLKRDWITLGDHLDPVYVRLGLASGPVQQAVVGHPQHQHLTVFGSPVNVAVNLCDIAPRDRHVIVIDQALYEQVQHLGQCRQLPSNDLGKAGRYTTAAYELIDLDQK